MKKVVNLSEYELNKIVKKILMSEQPTPGPAIQAAPISPTSRATSPTTRATSPTTRATSQTPGPQMPAAQGRPLPTPFNPQHKGTFEVDCKAGLSKLGYPGKLSKEGNKLFVELFCNPKYRNR